MYYGSIGQYLSTRVVKINYLEEDFIDYSPRRDFTNLTKQNCFKNSCFGEQFRAFKYSERFVFHFSFSEHFVFQPSVVQSVCRVIR